MAKTETQYFPLGGGLDVVTPALSVPPGRLLTCVNYEPHYSDGYRRINGYERFDGRPRPHLQTFIGLRVDDATGFAEGDTVTGGMSATTGEIIGTPYIDDGSLGTDMIAVTKIVGTGFVDTETITSSGTAISFLFPDANATDADSAMVTNDFTQIDEGITAADGFFNSTVQDEFPNAGAATVVWTLDDLPSSASAITEWVIRVRARFVRAGGETDDTATYRFRVTIDSEVNDVVWTAADAGAGFANKATTQAAPTGSPAQVDAATVTLFQPVYTTTGALDLNSIDIDAFELEVDYTPATAINAAPVARDAPDSDTEDIWLLAAWDLYRADILVVPGAGDVTGVWRRNADTYAVRNNVGETAGILHNASTSGWVTTGVTLLDTMKFDAGTDTPGPVWVVGDTVTGLVTGANGVIHSLIDWSGSYSGTDATGYLVLSGVAAGPFQDDEALQVGGVTIALANGINNTIAFSPAGNYRFINHNFFATSASFRVYGVNSLDNAFVIDESGNVNEILIPTVADLVTGGFTDGLPPDTTDKPFLIEEHRNYLFLAYPNGRVIQSVIGQPENFTAILDAAEFGLGSDITGLNSLAGSVLAISTEKDTRGLYGKTTADWEMKLIGEQTGARLYSAVTLDTVYALDDLGITTFGRTETFGDFAGATVSQLVQPIITALRQLANDATVVRESNQYRLYFSDNSAIIMFIPEAGIANVSRGTDTEQKVQFGFASYPIEYKKIYNSEDETGTERTFFASTDGFAYEDHVGNNFDGAIIRSYLRTAFTHLGTPALRKKFRRVDLELSSSKPLQLTVASDLTYGSSEVSSGLTELTTVDVPIINIFAGGGFWDDDNWDEFFWDGQNIATARADLQGTGENISFLIFHESAVANPFVLQGLTIHYDKRRYQR